MEDLALPAYFHLTVPISLNLSMAYGSTDKPTEMTALELPGGALIPYLRGAVLNVPTGFASILRFLHRKEEERLPFNIRGNISPSLLKALHGLK